MLILLLAVVLLPLAVAKLMLDYQAKKQNSTSGEVTLTVGELEQLVRRYVEDATDPLRERIRVLERSLEASESSEDGPTEDPFPLVDDPSIQGEDLRSGDDPSKPASDHIT